MFAIKYIIGSAIGLLAWEHAGKKLGTNIRPSVGINWAVPKMQNGFYWIGEQFAKLSSFFEYIKVWVYKAWK